MSQEMCRLCLGTHNLKPLFKIPLQWKRYEGVLLRTTGLSIKPNDGFPQTICLICAKRVEAANSLRNQSHRSEMQFHKLGFRKDGELNQASPHYDKRKNAKENVNKKICDVEFLDDSLFLNEVDRYVDVKDEEEYGGVAVETEEYYKSNLEFKREGTGTIRTKKKEFYLNKKTNDNTPGLEVLGVEGNNRSQKTNEADEGTELSRTRKLNDNVTDVEFLDDALLSSERFYDKLNVEDENEDGYEESEYRRFQSDEPGFSRKDKRELYLSLVDGRLDPQGPVKCKICKKTVSTWGSFISHSKLHLGFTFVCEFCGKSFISSTQLDRHSRSHHGKKRELACPHCDYLALDNRQLTVHKRRVHTGERPYVCDLCGASYHSRKCLIQHMENHLSVKSVECGKCHQMFKSRRHLSRHTYSVHTSKEFSYRCSLCQQVYSLKYMTTHLRKQHGAMKKDVTITKITKIKL